MNTLFKSLKYYGRCQNCGYAKFSLIAGSKSKTDSRSASGSSHSSQISSGSLRRIIDKLMGQQTRESTKQTYLRIWRQFNTFMIKLDNKPESWEDRTILFLVNLIDNGAQSSIIKSYVSAIKRILIDDGYLWDETKLLLSSLTRACRIVNDTVQTRLPIQHGLMELILFEIQRIYGKKGQLYLEIMYMAMISLAYYGLMRVGEITESPHVVKANNVHIAKNKNKILLVLYSSKTHSEASRPQKIKISSRDQGTASFNPFVLSSCSEITLKYVKIQREMTSSCLYLEIESL